MRRNLFKKANYLLPKVRVITETERSIRLEVVSSSPHEVVCEYKDFLLDLNCNCSHEAYKPNQLCSHKMAAITFLVNNPNIPIHAEVIEAVENIETKPFESPIK